ncbi:DUF559 domain-containing protein [Candidatus Peribacteria bacterium]|nr:MAG: DUF559 domain-containing protein [Candidatus Peribacteria bacterium]
MVRNTEFAKRLRRKQTSAEARLWTQLRRKKIMGYKFRRQVSIDHFIVDFICFEARLIIEVDGEIHKYQQKYDRLREEYLVAQKFTVLRFTNQEVFDDLERVLDCIQQATLSSLLSRSGGEEVLV